MALQVEIDPLVNKFGVHDYQNDPLSLIYPMYLNPSSSNYQRASPSYIFTSYPDPATMASSNTSHMHQNFSQHSDWVR